MSRADEAAEHIRRKADEENQAKITELKHQCPKLEVEAAHSAYGWRIRGLHNGQVMIDVKGQYLKGTAEKFRQAYPTALRLVRP